MNEIIVFPPVIGFTLMGLNIVLILTLLFFGLLNTQKPIKKADNTEEKNVNDQPLFEYGFEILHKSLETFYDKNKLPLFLHYVNKTIMRLSHADGAMLLLADNCTGSLELGSFIGSFPPPTDIPKAIENIEEYYKKSKLTFTDSIFNILMDSKKAEFIENTQTDAIAFRQGFDSEFTDSNGYSIFSQASSYIFIPLVIKEISVGIISLSKKQGSAFFSKEDFNLAKNISNFINMGLEAIYTYESISAKKNIILQENIASDLQTKLLYDKNPNFKGIEVESLFFAANGICSDYFDIIVARKDRASFVLADVIGRGIKSLMTINMIRSILRIAVNTQHTSSTLLTWLNRAFMYENTFENFASVSLLDYNDEKTFLSCANAGENPVLFFDSESKSWENLHTNTDPLGIAKDSSYINITKVINENDIVVLCTDGFFEAIDEFGTQYSIDRIKKNIEKYAHFSCKNIAERLKHDIIEYMENDKYSDDMSLIIIKGKKQGVM